MFNSASKVFNNDELSSKIFDFLGDNNIRKHFMPKFNKQILIYGQVQSGKTAKIMECIKKRSDKIIILVIQNSLSMLAQYEKALETNNIKFCTISSNATSRSVWFVKTMKSNAVLLVMNNNYRRDSLDRVLFKTKLTNYSLIIDESDMYYSNLKDSKLFRKAHECIHVTATPFNSGYSAYFDDIMIIPPKKEYIGFNKLDIKFIPTVHDEYAEIMKIINNDFLKKKQGIMLITIHNRIEHMANMSRYLSKIPSLFNVPVVTLSSNNVLYFNKKVKELQKMAISEIISGLDKHDHIIFIANRLATRGINYSNTTYTRHLTHQIIKKNNNKTNFIQRCRILGNKEGVKEKLKLYCLNCTDEYFDSILEKIKKLDDVDYLRVGYLPKSQQKLKLVRSKTM